MYDIDMDLGPIRIEAEEDELPIKMGQLILVGDEM